MWLSSLARCSGQVLGLRVESIFTLHQIKTQVPRETALGRSPRRDTAGSSHCGLPAQERGAEGAKEPGSGVIWKPRPEQGSRGTLIQPASYKKILKHHILIELLNTFLFPGYFAKLLEICCCIHMLKILEVVDIWEK